MEKLVVLSGAGISAESGFSTFRDSGGLWEKYSVQEVCTPEGYHQDPEKVLDFYNGLRHQLVEAQPNEAHRLVAQLEKWYDVTVITQNVDDLHERAGSSKVVHLHGELMKATSSRNPNAPTQVVTLPEDHLDIHLGDKAKDGSQLRPFIVWFEEPVPMMEEAVEYASQADLFLIIGTSLNVYPAAGLVNYVPVDIPVYLIDPKPVQAPYGRTVHALRMKASEGMRAFTELLEKERNK